MIANTDVGFNGHQVMAAAAAATEEAAAPMSAACMETDACRPCRDPIMAAFFSRKSLRLSTKGDILGCCRGRERGMRDRTGADKEINPHILLLWIVKFADANEQKGGRR